jgi:hypothetical protein
MTVVTAPVYFRFRARLILFNININISVTLTMGNFNRLILFKETRRYCGDWSNGNALYSGGVRLESQP